MAAKKMSRYESPCAKFIYDPEVGDHERNIPPGTPFEDLPDDWCCPKCGAEKEYFEELDDQGAVEQRESAGQARPTAFEERAEIRDTHKIIITYKSSVFQ